MLTNLKFYRILAVAIVAVVLTSLIDERITLVIGGVALLFLTGDMLAPVAVSLYNNNVRERVRAWMRRK